MGLTKSFEFIVVENFISEFTIALEQAKEVNVTSYYLRDRRGLIMRGVCLQDDDTSAVVHATPRAVAQIGITLSLIHDQFEFARFRTRYVDRDDKSDPAYKFEHMDFTSPYPVKSNEELLGAIHHTAVAAVAFFRNVRKFKAEKGYAPKSPFRHLLTPEEVSNLQNDN